MDVSSSKNNIYNATKTIYMSKVFSDTEIVMGKAKKRILYKTNSDLYMTRESAVSKVSEIIKKSVVRESQTVSGLITLFGLSAEELSEAGVPYENLVALSNIMQ